MDTNVFVYLYDHADAVKQHKARTALTERSEQIVISTQVLTEFYWVATRKLGIDGPTAQEAVRQMATLRVVPVDHRLVLRATETAVGVGLSMSDALIVEAAAASGSTQLLTEDLNDSQIIRDVRITNPFAET